MAAGWLTGSSGNQSPFVSQRHPTMLKMHPIAGHQIHTLVLTLYISIHLLIPKLCMLRQNRQQAKRRFGNLLRLFEQCVATVASEALLNDQCHELAFATNISSTTCPARRFVRPPSTRECLPISPCLLPLSMSASSSCLQHPHFAKQLPVSGCG